jgi:hypothetical protein
MKRCPTCQRTYSDDTQSYCMEDGTPLVREGSQDDSFATVVASPRRSEKEPPSPVYKTIAATGAPTAGASYNPPPPYQTPTRSFLPWVLAGVALLLFTVLGMAFAGYMIFKQSPSVVNSNIATSNPNTNNVANTGSGSNSNAAAGNSNTNRTSSNSSNNSASGNTNQNSNTHSVNMNTANVNQAPDFNGTGNSGGDTAPSDEGTVMAQLNRIENVWFEANIKADKLALQGILDDTYRGSGPDGNVQTKQQYLDTLQPDNTIRNFRFGNLRLNLNGNQAALTGFVYVTTGNAYQTFRFTDEFMWKRGNWRAVGSRTSRVK